MRLIIVEVTIKTSIIKANIKIVSILTIIINEKIAKTKPNFLVL